MLKRKKQRSIKVLYWMEKEIEKSNFYPNQSELKRNFESQDYLNLVKRELLLESKRHEGNGFIRFQAELSTEGSEVLKHIKNLFKMEKSEFPDLTSENEVNYILSNICSYVKKSIDSQELT